jgi:hypothetical protein
MFDDGLCLLGRQCWPLCMISGDGMQQMVTLLHLFMAPKSSKSQAKPSGLPDSNFIFFVATKKTKQKKPCHLAVGMSYAQCRWRQVRAVAR